MLLELTEMMTTPMKIRHKLPYFPPQICLSLHLKVSFHAAQAQVLLKESYLTTAGEHNMELHMVLAAMIEDYFLQRAHSQMKTVQSIPSTAAKQSYSSKVFTEPVPILSVFQMVVFCVCDYYDNLNRTQIVRDSAVLSSSTLWSLCHFSAQRPCWLR